MTFEPIHHSPAPQEIAARIARVQARMAEEQLDWYVCHDPDNVFYLTNFANFVHERPFVLLIPARGKLSFIVPKLEIPHVQSRSVGDIELIDYFEFPAPEGGNWFDKLHAVLGSQGVVGVESICPLQVYEAIKAERLRTDIVDDLRMIKSPYEIGRLVHAGMIASDAMADLLARAAPGRSLGEVGSAGTKLMFDAMVRDMPSLNPLATRLTAIFQPSQIAHDPHNFTDLNMQMDTGGPHVSIVAGVMNGYGFEIERTFFLGHVPEAAKKPYDVMMQARHLTFEMTKPGVRMCDGDLAVNALFKKAGYEENLLHRAGHGMGVTAHEAPFLAEGDARIIEPGMSFTVEPGIYFPGIGGFRHSDTLIVTDDANVSITHAPDSLDAMTL